MKNIIQINKENSTKYLFIDNISSIVVKGIKQNTELKYEPVVVKKYWIPLFNTIRGGYYYTFRCGDYIRGYMTRQSLLELNYFFRGDEIWESAKITFNLNNGYSHTLTYNDDKITEFDSLVEEIKKLTNVVIQVK
jgi:hypothetical protein